MVSEKFQFHLRTRLLIATMLSAMLAVNLWPHVQQGSFWNIIDSRQESLGWPFYVCVHYDDGCVPEIAAIGIEPVYDVFSFPALIADSIIAIVILAATALASEWQIRYCQRRREREKSQQSIAENSPNT
jgi:hypothetical protein